MGEADVVEYYGERVRFVREHMLDSKPKLTGRCVGLGLNVLWMCLVKASWTVTLYVPGEALPNVCCFSYIEAWVDKFFRPATSTSVTTPRPKRSTSHISAPEHRKKFAKQRNRSWRGSISHDRRLWRFEYQYVNRR